jgi:hypothetical protein
VVVEVVLVVVEEVGGNDVVDVMVNVEQDARNIETAIKKVKPNQITFFFNRFLLFY